MKNRWQSVNFRDTKGLIILLKSNKQGGWLTMNMEWLQSKIKEN